MVLRPRASTPTSAAASRVQRLPGRSRVPHERRARATRPGAVLRHEGCSRRCRNVWRAGRQPVRAGPRRERPRDRGAVRDGQHHRDGDGAELSRSGRKHRLHDGLRLCGRAARCRPLGRRADVKAPISCRNGAFTSAHLRLVDEFARLMPDCLSSARRA